MNLALKRLAILNADPKAKIAMADQVNALSKHSESTLQAKKEVGEYFADYLMDNGYHPGESATLIQQMIKSSFPTITKSGRVTAENVENRLLTIAKLMNRYIELDNKDDSEAVKIGLLLKDTK